MTNYSKKVALKRVVVESPYQGDIKRNVKYARACVRDCLLRGESPLASHLLYTQDGILDDNVPEERALGIAAGLAWFRSAELVVFYVDHDWSPGMREAFKLVQNEKIPYKVRALDNFEKEEDIVAEEDPNREQAQS